MKCEDVAKSARALARTLGLCRFRPAEGKGGSLCLFSRYRPTTCRTWAPSAEVVGTPTSSPTPTTPTTTTTCRGGRLS